LCQGKGRREGRVDGEAVSSIRVSIECKPLRAIIGVGAGSGGEEVWEQEREGGEVREQEQEPEGGEDGWEVEGGLEGKEAAAAVAAEGGGGGGGGGGDFTCRPSEDFIGVKSVNTSYLEVAIGHRAGV